MRKNENAAERTVGGICRGRGKIRSMSKSS